LSPQPAAAAPAQLDHWVGYLRTRALIPPGPLPIQQLPSSASTTVLRVGEVVLKQAPRAAARRAADAMRRLPELTPPLLWQDEQAGVLVTRHVPGANWQRLLAGGRIEARTFESAGRLLRASHDKTTAETCDVLVHNAFLPENVIVGPRGELQVVGWGAAGQGPAETDVTTLLAELLVDSARRPYTEDWYIDAGRAFLAGYGMPVTTRLTSLVGDRVLSLVDNAAAMPGLDGPGRDGLRRSGEALLFGRQTLPW
jgi:aminoglycoside phosphotransferase (APT) family kinase protein